MRCGGSPRRSSPRSDTLPRTQRAAMAPGAPGSREESHVKTMKIGLQFGYWGAGPPANALDQILEAERLGYDSVWTAESWGSDALTPLAWWGSHTTKASVSEPRPDPALRPPADGDRDGRAHDGPPLRRTLRTRPRCLRSPGRRRVVRPAVPQVPRWQHAQSVDIIRQVLAREAPVTSDGPHYPLPHPGGLGLGKPSKPITHPLRADLPIFLGAEGPKNVAGPAAEIADGWFPIFYSAAHDDMSSVPAPLEEGWARPGVCGRAWTSKCSPPPRSWSSSRTTSRARLTCSSRMIALYVGGMGARERYELPLRRVLPPRLRSRGHHQDPGPVPRRATGQRDR